MLEDDLEVVPKAARPRNELRLHHMEENCSKPQTSREPFQIDKKVDVEEQHEVRHDALEAGRNRHGHDGECRDDQ